MSQPDLQSLADRLNQARVNAQAIPPLTNERPLEVEDAYRIQQLGAEFRFARGEKLVGYKMGLTSEAKRKQMNLHSPVYGVLTDQMQVVGGTMSLQGSIHPKIEPELAFRTHRELKGKISREEAFDAIAAVMPALEVLDSRYRDFKYFSLPDVIADNSSSYRFVLGEELAEFRALDLKNLKMELHVNGALLHSAPSSAISGDPVLSLVQQVELLAGHGKTLPAGSIVLAGAATAAHALQPGDRIELRVEGLTSLTVEVRA